MHKLGNVTITESNKHEYAGLSSINGHLTVGSGVRFNALALQNIRGWLTLMPDAAIEAPHFGKLDGWLTLHRSARCGAQALETILADAVFHPGSTINAPKLQFAAGVSLLRGASISLPSFARTRRVALLELAALYAPELIEIGGSLTLRADARLDAPKLTTVAGYLDLDEGATLLAPAFK